MTDETYQKARDFFRKKVSLKAKQDSIKTLTKIDSDDPYDADKAREIGGIVVEYADESHILNPLWNKFLTDSKIILDIEMANIDSEIEKL